MSDELKLSELPPAATAAAADGAAILLVDDQPARLLTYEAILAGLDVQCVRALSGRAALAQMLKQEFAVIVLDVSMPEMDGFEVARLMRSQRKLERTPIIFATGVHVSEFDQLKGYEVGAIDYISVPVVPEILRSKVAILVELYQRRRQLQALNEARQRVSDTLTGARQGDGAARDFYLRAAFEHPAFTTGVLEARRDAGGQITDWVFRDANANAIRILGGRRENFIGRTLREVHPDPQRAAHAAAMYARALTTGELISYDSRVAERDYLVTAFPADRDTVIASALDVTEQRLAEAALRDSERRHGAVLEGAPVGLIYADLDGRIQYVNEAFCRLLGYTAGELHSLTAQHITHPDDLEREQALARQVRAGQLPNYTLEKRYLRKDGAAVWVTMFGNYVPDDHGRPIQAVAIAIDMTARRLAESRLQSVVRSIDDLLVCVDHEWRFTYVNDTTARLLERPAQELLGTCLWELFPDATSDFRRDVHAAAREQRVIVAEHYYQPWNKWFENHIYPSSEGVTVLSADITARKHVERALQDSQARLNLAAEAAHLGTHDWDIASGSIQWDRRTRELWGVGVHEPISYEIFSAGLHPDDRLSTQRAVDRAVDPGGDGRFRATYRVINRRDRVTRWVEATGAVSFENGRAVRLVGTVQDVTERTLADERLKASEERFRELANNVDQLVWTCDELGHATWYNNRWYEYTGTSFEEMQGQGWQRVQDPAHLERVTSHLQRCMASGEQWEDTFPIRGSNGAYRWFLSRAVPIRDAAGRVVRWFGTNTDVTEQRKLQEALKSADRRKDEFLAMLAHELRNPLAPISAASEVLWRLNGNRADQQALIQVVRRQTAQLARLLDDLLDVARITQGRIQLKLEVVALLSCVDLAVETVAPLLRERGHRLTITRTAEDLNVKVDRARIVQCIVNVLTNAAKYTQPGGEIAVHTEARDGRALIKIVDNGIGIPADLLPGIFDLFVQNKRELARSEGGLGIGLSVCRQLLSMQGGSIAASSAGAGRGSTFSIELPLTAGAGDAVQAEPMPSAQRRRVLVVDDNQDAADMLARVLELHGHEPRVAYSAESGLGMLAAFQPEILVLDIGLPGMDGYEFARQVSRSDTAPKLIAVSGYGRPADKERSAAAGFDAHLVKPVDFTALARLLEHSYGDAQSSDKPIR